MVVPLMVPLGPFMGGIEVVWPLMGDIWMGDSAGRYILPLTPIPFHLGVDPSLPYPEMRCGAGHAGCG